MENVFQKRHKEQHKGNSRVKLWIVMTVLLLTAAVLPAGCGIQEKIRERNTLHHSPV